MATIRSYCLSEDTAINSLSEIIHEIYQKQPTSMSITLDAGMDRIATVHVEYDGYVLNKELNRHE